ncbi:MAG: hypothetical protein HKUEN02_09760 [Anaerolineaceae bacterium]|nr:MAG: hypothetical protein HKUEN02_09760 [Anaerolineaceae bacterium]
MPNSRKPFRTNVGFIVHQEVGYSHEIPFEFESAKFEDLEVSHLAGSIHIGRTPQGLIAQGKFSADVALECARCLRSFPQRLNWKFTELFAINKDSTDENGLLLPEDMQIDFAPILREYALLEAPINPLHDPACKGLCIECGQDLNEKDCGHSQHPDDSPFSILQKLL